MTPNAGKVLHISDTTQRVRSEIGCELSFEVAHHVVLALQVAAASTAGSFEDEQIVVELNGRSVAFDEVEVEHGDRVHLIACGAGYLTVSYHAVVQRTRSLISPRPSLTDTAFSTTVDGGADLVASTVTAFLHDNFQVDDHLAAITLP